MPSKDSKSASQPKMCDHTAHYLPPHAERCNCGVYTRAEVCSRSFAEIIGARPVAAPAPPASEETPTVEEIIATLEGHPTPSDARKPLALRITHAISMLKKLTDARHTPPLDAGGATAAPYSDGDLCTLEQQAAEWGRSGVKDQWPIKPATARRLLATIRHFQHLAAAQKTKSAAKTESPIYPAPPSPEGTGTPLECSNRGHEYLCELSPGHSGNHAAFTWPNAGERVEWPNVAPTPSELPTQTELVVGARNDSAGDLPGVGPDTDALGNPDAEATEHILTPRTTLTMVTACVLSLTILPGDRRMADRSVHDRLARGEVVQVGRQLWQVCGLCEEPVRLNKPLIGSFHLCLNAEEIEMKRRRAPFRQFFGEEKQSP